MIVRPLSIETAKQIAEWRNMSRNALRTGWTTLEQQEQFYKNNFLKDYMYWEFIENATSAEWSGPGVLAAGGFVNISWKLRTAEIALIVHPQGRLQGFGERCAEWIFHEGFMNQNFKFIHGEVYGCGPVRFWEKINKKYKAFTSVLQGTQFWEGRYWDSIVFSIERGDYEEGRSKAVVFDPVGGGRVSVAHESVRPDTRVRPLDNGATCGAEECVERMGAD